MENKFYTETIKKDPAVDFTDKNKINLVMENGSFKLLETEEAIKQWIIKFCLTEKDAYPIYEGLGYGTRIKSLLGRKRLGYGYEEAEIERDFREGLPLCPGINQVRNFELEKSGKSLNIKVEVELTNGYSLDVKIANVYTL